MYIPVVRKIVERDSVYMERCLPEKGKLVVSIGDTVRPFDHLGHCTVSQRIIELPENFKLTVQLTKENKTFIYYGSVIGKTNDKKITVPFNGYLMQDENKKYKFEEEAHRYSLLAGVWGTVDKVFPDTSVLLKTSTLDLQMIAATNSNFVGELVVFPNQKDFFEKYFVTAVNEKPSGKIIYVGEYIDYEMLNKSAEIGVGALISGSGKRELLAYAKKIGVHLGFISGFGKVKTPDKVFNKLNSTVGRLVFFYGDKKLLRIPIPVEEQNGKKSQKNNADIKKLRKNSEVLIFQGAYFGYLGEVDTIKESSILVKLQGVNDPVEIFVPNFFILE